MSPRIITASGLLSEKHLLRLAQGVAHNCPHGAGVYFKIIIWWTKFEFLKKHIVQLSIVVLAGVDKNVVGVFVQFWDEPGKPNNFRPGANNGHDFESFQRPSSCLISGLVPTMVTTLSLFKDLAPV